MIEIQKIIDIAIEAGTAIIEIYNSDDFNVEIKSDNTLIIISIYPNFIRRRKRYFI
jgi:3'-phosphoadenosine 5'-phosphosulfate (PAPS) 3'-phosphatase